MVGFRHLAIVRVLRGAALAAVITDVETEGSAVARSDHPAEWLNSLRVFGRLPITGARACTEAGVRKASREETAGEFAPAVVSVYGDLTRGSEPPHRFRTGTAAE
jgi:hypothetical protein